jgi:hypothetical protein
MLFQHSHRGLTLKWERKQNEDFTIQLVLPPVILKFGCGFACALERDIKFRFTSQGCDEPLP